MSTQTNISLEKFGYKQSLKRVLSVKSLIFYGLAYMMPLTLFTSYGIVTQMTHGMLALAYLVATIGIVFTALSYRQMVKDYPVAGSAYSYVQRSINPHIGFLSGGAILMYYLLMPILCYVCAAIYLQTLFPSWKTWIIVVVLVAVVTLVSYIGMKMTSIVNNALVILQLIFVVALVIYTFKWISAGNGTGTFFALESFFNHDEFHDGNVGWSAIFTGSSVLAISFLGFDAVTTVAEETLEPEKNIGKAIVIICIGAGALSIFEAYLYQLAWPSVWNEFKVVDSAAFELVEKIAGTTMSYLFSSAYVIGSLGTALASQISASRILFGMGRDNVLPKRIFAHVNVRFQTPTYNILILAAISLAAAKLSLATTISLINFGALTGFILVNLSVISHYYIRKNQRTGISVLNYLVLPLCGAVACFTIRISLDVHSKMLGFIWLAVGTSYLAITTRFFTQLPPELDLSEN